jgi:zinc protease
MAIATHTLPNGMQVVLEENHAAKVISFNALVKVGSADETDKEAGICHVIEHMLFKGTTKRPTGTIAMDVEAAGGDINAYTSFDQTVYYINMATRFADDGLEILADAIKDPLFDTEELKKEAEVICEEIRREKDNPSHMVGEHLFQTAFSTHTYGRPVIGYPETVKSFTRDDLFAFYRRWYTPRNIVFVVVGDFDSDDMLKKIGDHFSDFTGDEAPIASVSEEPEQSATRIVVGNMNVQSAYLAIAYHIPSITHEDVPALDLMSHILGGSDSSRLEQEVKEKKRLVHSIFASAYTPKHPGIMYISSMCSDGNLKGALCAIADEIERLKEEPVTAAELSRAKINLRSSEVYEKETVAGEAGKIASFIATAGSYEFEKRYFQMLSDVSAEDIMEVARRYLTPQNATLAMVLPDGSVWTEKKAELTGCMTKTSAKIGLAKKSAKDRPIVKRLSCGATLILKENHKLPIVAICAAALGGTRMETRKLNGISALFSRTMVKGTKTRTAIDIARDIEKLAGNIGGFSGRNTVGVKCEFLSEHLHDGIGLFADVMCNPDFAASEVAKEKALQLKAIKDQEDNLSSVAFAKFLEALFPTHPYGLKAIGTAKSVKAITPAILKQYHARAMCGRDAIISVVGDINTSEVVRLMDELLAGLPSRHMKAKQPHPDPAPKRPITVEVLKKKKQQSHIVLGFPGTTYKNRDRFAMAVLNNILSGQGGRLFRKLRDDMSLAYAVNSVNHEGIEPGYFAVYIGTDPSKEKTAIDAILAELRSICEDRVTEAELMRSKQYLVGTYELDLQRNSALSNIYTFYELYGLGLDEIDHHTEKIMDVSVDDVLKAAQRYIKLNSYVLSIVRPS